MNVCTWSLPLPSLRPSNNDSWKPKEEMTYCSLSAYRAFQIVRMELSSFAITAKALKVCHILPLTSAFPVLTHIHFISTSFIPLCFCPMFQSYSWYRAFFKRKREVSLYFHLSQVKLSELVALRGISLKDQILIWFLWLFLDLQPWLCGAAAAMEATALVAARWIGLELCS